MSMQAKIWYMAHPVASDNQYSEKENLAHSLRVAREIWDSGFCVILPWHTHCLFLDDKDKAHRKAGLECDIAVIKKCKGLILTGHKISDGMQLEVEAAESVQARVINLVGVPTRQIRAVLTSWDRVPGVYRESAL